MDALKNLVTPFVGSSGLVDGVKLVVLGGTVETARRISSSAWSSFVNSFFLTAHFTEEDYPYDWLMHWLAKQPAWQKSREFETTTRTTTVGLNPRRGSAFGSGDDSDADEDQEDPEDELTPGKQKVKVVFQPTFDTTLTIYYKGHWLRVRRSKKTDGSDVEVLSISVVARSNTILKQLVLQAKREYEADAIHRIQIYFADSHGSWRWTDSRHKRPMSSIVLQPGVKEMLLADARDFLRSEKWYADRGIPFRRGFLLFGVPGSGKTSLIHAIAGELSLDIYVISLSASWMTDSTLTTLMGRVPARCILLLEDLDAAFTRSVTRDSSSTGAPSGPSNSNGNSGNSGNGNNGNNGNGNNGNGNHSNNADSISDVNTLSLSGLLNAIDGVAAAEGRILFATTNHLERLDPALSRPGRMDVWIEFKNASKWQAEQLFRNFFPSSDEPDPRSPTSDDEELAAAGVTDSQFKSTPIGASGASTPTSASGSFNPASASSSLSLSAASLSLSSAALRRLSNVSAASSSAGTTATTSSASSSSSPSSERANAESGSDASGAKAGKSPKFAYEPPPPLDIHQYHSAPAMDSFRLAELAKMFADAIPDDEFSVAALQGYLLKNKSRPEAAAHEAAAWVVSERELRERLKREKEARERKEREDKERRRREAAAEKEKEEKERAKKRAEEEEERLKKDKEAKEKEGKEKAEKGQPKTEAASPAPAASAKPAPDAEKKAAAGDAAPSAPAQAVAPTVAVPPTAPSTSTPAPTPGQATPPSEIDDDASSVSPASTTYEDATSSSGMEDVSETPATSNAELPAASDAQAQAEKENVWVRVKTTVPL